MSFRVVHSRRLSPCFGLLSLSLSLGGCPRMNVPEDASVDVARADVGPEGREDGTVDVPTSDAMEDAGGALEDAGEASDAADVSAPRADASRDAGASCACPPMPERCAPPPAESPEFSSRDTGLLRQLHEVIACANATLDVAIYEVDNPCFVDALRARLEASPALTVRVVTDNGTCPLVMGRRTCALSGLEGHPRVTMIDDGRSTLMHHKFIVADGARLWLGSANMTRRSFCTDENNGLVFDNPAVVAAYRGEFRRMFEDRAFGPIVPEPTPPRTDRLAVFFSPRSPVASAAPWHAALLREIAAATRTIDFSVAFFTRTDLSDALIAARARGVRVRGIVGASTAMDPAIVAMRRAGLDVRAAEMHSKTVVIDDDLTTTGSANWSTNAWSNNENSLWIRDNDVASAYRSQFERSFALARPIPAP